MFRTDGQSDQYRAFATMWRVPDNLLNVFFNINASFGSDYFVLISQHNCLGKTTIEPFLPYLPRGEKWLYSHFSGGDLLYSHFSAYPGKGEIWLYSHFSGRKWLWGEMALYHRLCQPLLSGWVQTIVFQ